jgi:hypothetical protein
MQTKLHHRSVARCLRPLVMAFGLALAAGPAVATGNDFEIEVLSSRPDTVTGGDALVRVEVPPRVRLPR